MAQTRPKAGQFYGVSDNGITGQVLISDGNGGFTYTTDTTTVSGTTITTFTAAGGGNIQFN